MARNSGPSKDETVRDLRNEDPITGEAGAHPVGAGLGAAAAGSAAGAAGGALGGPVGAVVGAVAGGVAGAYAGKEIAEGIDPTVETEYWRSSYAGRPYYNSGYTYDDYAPAYQTGWELEFDESEIRPWADRESEARRIWENRIADEDEPVGMTWDEAKAASRDAYERIAERKRQQRLNKPR